MSTQAQHIPPARPSRRRGLFAGLALTAMLLLSATHAADLVAIPALGLSVARGFRVTQVADAGMAHDIRSLTFTPEGRIAVSGPGYIRILHDANNDGVADGSTLFAMTDTGASGMCFDGDALYCAADGFFWRYLDADADGVADGPAERLFALPAGDDGAHAVRKGPDGFLYVSVGHDCALLRGQLGDLRWRESKPEAGLILRCNPEGRNPGIIAHGFFNPVGLDFNSMGDLFTADGSVDADLHLPWYVPARVFHVAPMGHHGWRVDDQQRCWPRPEIYPDTMSSAADLARALPAGVACYRHTQFPTYFHEGLFVCDWAHGRVLFVRLAVDGSSYVGAPEDFVSAIGAAGFAPTAVAVGPDGSLFVSTGGRHARGSVWRVQYTGAPAALPNWRARFATELQTILGTPQPLDAWAREGWVPAARRLGPEAFARVAADPASAPMDRVRAIEILTELFGGLVAPLAADTARAEAPEVRARTAWSLGVHPPENAGTLLLTLARDIASPVRRAAMESLQETADSLNAAGAQAAITANLAHPDKRLHLPATRLAAGLSEAAWTALWDQSRTASVAVRVPVILAHLWRHADTRPDPVAIDAALAVLATSRDAGAQLDAARLVVLGLGDWRMKQASAAAFAGFEPGTSLNNQGDLVERVGKIVVPMFPSGHVGLDLELARLLAMLGSALPELPVRLLDRCSGQSAPEDDFHYLTALACLRGPDFKTLNEPLAAALVAMDHKLDGLDPRQLQWRARLTEVTERLLPRTPGLGAALVRQRDFARAAHLGLVDLLGADLQPAAARAFLAAVRSDRQFPASDALIDLLSTLPPTDTAALFRQQWNNLGLRDRLLLEFAARPVPADAEKFTEGLLSPRMETARACVTALLKLPPDSNGKPLVPTLRLLRRLIFQPTETAMRERTLALVEHLSGRKFKVVETGRDPDVLRNNYAPVFLWLANTRPALVRQLDADDDDDPVKWPLKVRGVDWNRGQPGRGEEIYLTRGCAFCHSGAAPLGPDLETATSRMSPADLILSVVFPSREIAPAWRTTHFRLRDGAHFSGLVTFEGHGVVIAQTGAATNVRLAESAIIDRWPGTPSLMPPGLLRDASRQAMADLNAYLRTLANDR